MAVSGKNFTLKGLAPNSTYIIEVLPVPANGEPGAWSKPIKFNTNGKDVAPPPVQSLVASYDTDTFNAVWDGDAALAEKDFKSFSVTITSSNFPSISQTFSTTSESFSLSYGDNISIFGSLASSITITVRSRDTSNNLSDPVSATAENGPPADPTNVTVSTLVLGYSVSWDAPTDPDYSHTKIYESSTVNGTYEYVKMSTTIPVTINTTTFTERFVKVSHVDVFGNESNLAPSTGISVTPTNPAYIDLDPPGSVTNASATFDGTNYILTFDPPVDVDLRDFIITLTGNNEEFGESINTSVFPLVPGTSPNTQTFKLSYQENINFFGVFCPDICASIIARDLSVNNSAAVEDICAIYDDSISAPTNVVFIPGILSYVARWDRPLEDTYSYSKIYESSTENGTYSFVAYGTTPLTVSVNSSDPRYVKVTHVTTGGTESDASIPQLVSPINPVSVDTTPPDQRTNISYTPGVGSMTVSWTNPSGSINEDVAGITVRYAKTSSPTNYTWIDIPFTYSSPLTTATVNDLLPLTSYDFSISTFDKTQNRTSYSTSSTQITLGDTSPPPRPKAPTVTAGSAAGGPMLVIVSQESIQHGTSTALPLDIADVKVFMLDSGYSSAPGTGISTNTNASEIGMFTAGFNGGTNQEKFYVPLQQNEQRYFYTRITDTSGNISDASPAVQSTAMTVFDSAYISSLTADKIATGTLTAGRYIDVGPSSSTRIRIENVSGGVGRIFSGIGTYSNSNTGFYFDSDGKFSLKDRLSFDGTNLSLTGSITASGGSFTGNVLLNGGSLYATGPGGTESSGQRVIFNANGLAGYDSAGSNKFNLTTAGLLTAKSGTIGGWTISDTTLSSTGVTIDSTGQKIRFGPSGVNPIGVFTIGYEAGGTGNHGIYIDANDYIYGNGNFSLANGALTWNGNTLSVTGNGSFSGQITAASGSFTGPVQIGESGSLYAGTLPGSGARVALTSTGITAYDSTSTNQSTGVAFSFGTANGGVGNIAGWSFNKTTIEKISGGAGITLDSSNIAITLTSGTAANTLGLRASSTSGDVVLWAGAASAATASATSPFYVTNTGFLYARGIRIGGGLASASESIVNFGTVDYAIKSDDGKDIILRALSGGDPAKIRWIDSDNYQRGTLGWEAGAGSVYQGTLVLRAIAGKPTQAVPAPFGQLLLDATNDGTIKINAKYINLDPSQGGAVTINGATIETSATLTNRYRNGTASPSGGNTIKYGDVSTKPTNPNNGDIYLQYS